MRSKKKTHTQQLFFVEMAMEMQSDKGIKDDLIKNDKSNGSGETDENNESDEYDIDE